MIGDGAGVWSFVHVDDAAPATRGRDRARPARRLQRRRRRPRAAAGMWLPALAEALGRQAAAARPGAGSAGSPPARPPSRCSPQIRGRREREGQAGAGLDACATAVGATGSAANWSRRGRSHDVSASYDPVPMLYGRDGERSCIGEVLDGARESRSAVLVLRGEAGVGKSALLEDACAQADGHARPARTRHRVRGAAALRRPPSAAAAAPRRGSTTCPRRRRARCAARSGSRPAPATSGSWSRSPCSPCSPRSPSASRCCAWSTTRTGSTPPRPRRWCSPPGGSRPSASRSCSPPATATPAASTRPSLEELPARAGSTPARRRRCSTSDAAGALSPEARARLIDGTGGNPLALLELSATLSEAQLTGAEPLFEPLPVSARVERAFLQRVRRLPGRTRSAAAGRRRRRQRRAGDRARARPAGSAPGAEALDAAEQAGLLRVDGPRLEFRHPLIRSAVYHGAPPSRRQRSPPRAGRRARRRGATPTGAPGTGPRRRRARPRRRRARSSRRRGAPAGAAASSPRRSRSSARPRWRPTSATASAC